MIDPVTARENATGQRLSKTSLRHFGPPIPHEDRDYSQPSYLVTLSRDEAPVPVLLRYALTLIGISHYGPSEKVEWWTTFTYKGYPCELAHQKFGVRLRIGGTAAEEEASTLLAEVRKKLRSAVRSVEKLLAETAGDTLNAGKVTVKNQNRGLRHAYNYFRERATNPDFVEDVHESGTFAGGGSWSSFRSGKEVMAMHAFHDLVAAISAFQSCLEHDLVLALPFLDFDPAKDDLTAIIGGRWGEKWGRVVGHSDRDAVRLRERLTGVVERWRNPYSHGGFEKGYAATVYLHTPGLGALPIGLSSIRDSPTFSFRAASDTDIKGVFALFDEIDEYLRRRFPHAMHWIDSGLAVQFDAAFRAEVDSCLKADGTLEPLIDQHMYLEDMIANMDYP